MVNLSTPACRTFCRTSSTNSAFALSFPPVLDANGRMISTRLFPTGRTTTFFKSFSSIRFFSFSANVLISSLDRSRPAFSRSTS